MSVEKKYIVRVDENLKDLIPFFIDETLKDFAKLEDFLTNGNCEGIGRLAHTLKGECASYGFVELGELAGRLEQVIGAADMTGAHQIFEEMKSKLASAEVHYEPEF